MKIATKHIVGLVRMLILLALSTGFGTTTAQLQTRINGGNSNSGIICNDGSLWLSGSNSHGQLGRPLGFVLSDVPHPVPNFSNSRVIAFGEATTYALRNDERVWAFGQGGEGELGNGSTDDNYVPRPVSGLEEVIDIAAGKQFAVALKRNQTIWVWGKNDYDQLSDAILTNSLIPIQVSGPGVTNVIDIAAGESHVLMLRSDGQVYAWGNNSNGQCGVTGTSTVTDPVWISSLSNVVAIAAGKHHSLALRNDGSVWAWGANAAGQLGLGDNIDRNSPDRISGMGLITNIASGFASDHSVALREGGVVFSWGLNDHGQLGDGTQIDSNSPLMVLGVVGATDVAAGKDNSFAIVPGGNVWSWGGSATGQAIPPYLGAFWIPGEVDLSCTVGNPSLLTGKIWGDENGDCTQDPAESGLVGWLVKAEDASGINSYAFTGSDGTYEIPVTVGTYTVTAVNGTLNWDTSACSSYSAEVIVLFPGDTSEADFYMEPKWLCPEMVVQLSTPALPRCDTTTYYVQYGNRGTVASDGLTTVEIDFDPDLEVVASSIPWRTPVHGNEYIFEVGSVPVNGGGAITVDVEVNCSGTIDGQAHCSKAHIYPDTFCFPPSPEWDGADIYVEARCRASEDSLDFLVVNGGSTMARFGGYVIIEDNILRAVDSFLLGAGDTLLITKPGNGSTWAVKADQSLEHPSLDTKVVAIMEGCGVNAFGTFSTGFVTSITHSDADPFIDIDCQQNVSAMPSNEKFVLPTGVGEAHLIEPYDDLNYSIVFQNTSADTAYHLTIFDTLSEFVDPASIIPGVSSHPYTLSIRQDRVLVFEFQNILLPPESVDESGSQGVATFHISQEPDNNDWIPIKNQAGIYFDYHGPVITNTVFNMVGEAFIVATDPPQEGASAQEELRIAPNPFREAARITLAGDPHRELSFELYSIDGRKVRSEHYFDSNSFRVQRSNLPAGIYIFKIISGGMVLHSGRLVAF